MAKVTDDWFPNFRMPSFCVSMFLLKAPIKNQPVTVFLTINCNPAYLDK